MRDKTERIIAMMNQMEETKKLATYNEAYDNSLRDLLRRTEEFTKMPEATKEKVLELLSEIHKMYVD